MVESARAARALVRGIDSLLRRTHGIYEYSQDPRCLLRISPIRSRWDLSLADGTRIAPGELLAVIHFWNERLPPMRPAGVDLQWARAFYRDVRPSLELLSEHLAATPRWHGVRALCGEATFMRSENMSAGLSLLSRIGLEVHPSDRGTASWQRLAAWGENLFSWLLMWTYNPASLRGRTPAAIERYWVWMSRRTLDEKYRPSAR